MSSLSLITVAMWLTVGVVAVFGLMAGMAAADATLTVRTRGLLGVGCAAALLLVLFFFAGGGSLLLALFIKR